MSRAVHSLQPLALAVVMAFAAAPLNAAESVPNAQASVRNFSIPAGDLSQALNNLA